MRTLSQRIIGACRLEAGAYEEVEADRSGTPQAALVVVLTSLAAGIGGMGAAGAPHVNLLTGTIGALAGWVSWAALTYLIGTHVLPEPETKADLGELLRTLAFASSPGLLRILGALPGLGAVVFVVSSLWMLAAMVVAVRQALDYRSTARAVGVCVLGWLLSLAVAAVIGLVFAPAVS